MTDGDLQGVFAEDGLLRQVVPGYLHREGQLAMAKAVAAAIRAGRTLIAEAGTGTGKTYAYLVPAILSGRRTIISTGTKNLQDQLFWKDLPVVRKALGVPFLAALLKGRNNYLCLYRMDNAMAFRRGHARLETGMLEKVARWSANTVSGDTAEMTELPESSVLWPQLTSTADNCLGQECPKLADCFLVKARRKAQDAEIVVVNHHLVWADWALKNDGFGELLPKAEVMVIDEAHQFAETATNFLSLTVTSRQINELADDIVTEQIKDAPDQPELARSAEGLENLAAELRLLMGVEARRDAWATLNENSDFHKALLDLQRNLGDLAIELRQAAVRGKGLEGCWKRCEELQGRLLAFMEDNDGEGVRWFETHKRGFSLNRTPLEIAGEFSRFHESSPATWIFTSATLSVSQRFDHFAAALGLHDADAHAWESPFDYARQSLFYLPVDLPEPSAPNYTACAVSAAIPVLEASRGRAFFLFTSYQAMQTAADLLKDQISYPLFLQGTLPKAALLEAFKAAGNGVLLGTASFWEGVDVRGPALSCVIIDKLPFAAPSDPVLTARMDALKARGQSPFGSYQLPAAVIALKQGVGRLIRSSEDRGVLMLCDPRIVSRPYGKVFLNSLPPMRRTRLLARVQAFYANEVAAVSPETSESDEDPGYRDRD